MKATEDRLKALMLQGLDGEAAAHRRLLAELARLLRGYYALRLGADQPDLEDLIQETLIAVHQRRMSYDASRPFTSWAFAMARYKMIDHLRRRRLRLTVPIDDEQALFADDGIEGAVAAMDLHRMMEDLTPQQRQSIHHVKVAGLSVAEAAKRAGMSESNVKISIHRGLRKLIGRARSESRDAN